MKIYCPFLYCDPGSAPRFPTVSHWGKIPGYCQVDPQCEGKNKITQFAPVYPVAWPRFNPAQYPHWIACSVNLGHVYGTLFTPRHDPTITWVVPTVWKGDMWSQIPGFSIIYLYLRNVWSTKILMNQGIQVVQSKTTLLILYIVHALIYRGYSLLLLCGTLLLVL